MIRVTWAAEDLKNPACKRRIVIHIGEEIKYHISVAEAVSLVEQFEKRLDVAFNLPPHRKRKA